ncbi:precorrin-2 dehydrogenase/sirohydrochlorin ferrochelatase family protein [Novosphingobium album (ex Hu et al. 2023)]|uniref:precorrin-2 dehydrogenase n=1 Tax=Novosphingobium album (ex Hu et al. 2023) TaxID=2930093 RepID=A0ABT0B0M1_9SPHN|nr:bifunctional precorrin-2 dehydrogenase/sirohydrochlorin ferrochelatase [Novosphingobium album (ex Hu et al. 2023)]MCJ2178565.1 siroheme synthase [Novosphingobium album (ex Hu et al. 2023)]
MIETLPLFHRIDGQPVVVLGMGEAAEAKRRLVERAGGLVIDDLQEGIDKGARLAFIAYEDDTAAEADAIRARCAGLLVNATDRPALCDFTVPSILDRSPVLVAIGTGGASAGLAKQVRLRLEQILPQSLGALASALGKARGALRARFPDAGDRRRALDAALGEGGALDVLSDVSAGRVEVWLSAAPLEQGGTVEIALRSDDPEDLTLKEARLLGSADVIAFERGVSSRILDRARADAQRAVLGKNDGVSFASGLTVIVRAPSAAR